MKPILNTNLYYPTTDSAGNIWIGPYCITNPNLNKVYGEVVIMNTEYQKLEEEEKVDE